MYKGGKKVAVIIPLSLDELREFFDEKAIEVLEFQLEKSVVAQPEIKDYQESVSPQITKEYLEQWCVQAIENVKPIGAGSYPIDIIRENSWGADIKALACKFDTRGNLSNSESGEASLAQKFTDTGENLDELFKNREFDKIAQGWLEIVKRKNIKVMTEKKIEKIYYFFFLRGNKEFYLCGTQINLDDLEKVIVNEEQSTNQSVYLKNYIDDRYGTTKIYKAKKRLELRLRAKNWVDDGLCIILPIPNQLNSVDLRKINLKEYRNSLFKK